MKKNKKRKKFQKKIKNIYMAQSQFLVWIKRPDGLLTHNYNEIDGCQKFKNKKKTIIVKKL